MNKATPLGVGGWVSGGHLGMVDHADTPLKRAGNAV